jgi:toxin-antitoxin system PIN domain toxin
VNVWIAAVSDRHEHHVIARRWFERTASPICFCRVTQMAFLRLTTNPKVMGEDVLRPPEAIVVYRRLLADERVRFAPEPPNLEASWLSLMGMSAASGSTWTDAYLAAFSLETDSRLISFDQGMRRWPGLAFELLMPA